MRTRRVLVGVLAVAVVVAVALWRGDETRAPSTRGLVLPSDAPSPSSPVKSGPPPVASPETVATAHIEGEVVDERGRPLEAATVEVKNANTLALLRARTNASGRFSLEVEAGEWFVDAEAPGYLPASIPPQVMAGAGTVISQLRLEMTRTSVITGVVRDESGLTVPDATVFIGGVVGVPRRPTRTDSYGRFRIEFDAKARGGFLAVRHDCCLDVSHRLPTGAQPSDLTIRLQRVELERSTFTGVVVDEHDAPVAATPVSLYSLIQRDGGAVQREARVVTDAQGTFSASLPGQVVLAFASNERGEIPMVTLLASTPGRLVLRGSPAAVTGRVTDEAGQPVTRFQVRVASEHHAVEGIGLFATGDGRYRVTLHSSGSMTVFLEGDGFAPVERPLTVLAGQPTTEVDFVVSRSKPE